MGILSLVSSIPARICRGNERAHLGAWAVWKKNQENALLRVTMIFHGGTYQHVDPISWSFLPIRPEHCWYNLEFTPEIREALVGSNRSTKGVFEFEFLMLNGDLHTVEYSLYDILEMYRGEGAKPPSQLLGVEKPVLPDTPEIAALDLEGLKQKSAEIVAEIKAQKEREEQERLAAEKAAKEAAAAAAAPKAAGSGGAADADPSPKAKIGLVYGSSTGNTAEVAEQIKAAFGEDSFLVKNVTEISEAVFKNFDNIILGVPTWHIGEMQDDWAAFLPGLDAGKFDFKGRKLAIFGLGDGKGYPDTYVDAMMELWEKFKPSGIELVGLWPTEGYEYEKSLAIIDGKFVGLVVDIENQADMTQGRVDGWVKQLKGELKL